MMNIRRNSIVYTHIVEYTGLFTILNPNVHTLYDINISKLIVSVEFFILGASKCMLAFSMYYSINNVKSFVNYFMLFVAFLGMSINQFYVINNSDVIFDLLNIKTLNFYRPALLGWKRLKWIRSSTKRQQRLYCFGGSS